MKAFILITTTITTIIITTTIIIVTPNFIQVRKGSVGVTYSEGCSAEDRQLVSTMFSRCPLSYILHHHCNHNLHIDLHIDLDIDDPNVKLSSVARCTEIPEKLQNAFAAMAGSGPAYIYQVRFGVILV